MKLVIDSPQAMIALGKELAEKDHTHILLYGDLGAGKTHFVKGFALGLDLSPDLVTSPTYAYSNIYESQLLHCDFYRLEEKQELWHKGLIDSIEEYDQVLIEWPKWEQHYADENWLKVEIEKIDEMTRHVTVTQFSP